VRKGLHKTILLIRLPCYHEQKVKNPSLPARPPRPVSDEQKIRKESTNKEHRKKLFLLTELDGWSLVSSDEGGEAFPALRSMSFGMLMDFKGARDCFAREGLSHVAVGTESKETFSFAR
jgi:hypothetical protein